MLRTWQSPRLSPGFQTPQIPIQSSIHGMSRWWNRTPRPTSQDPKDLQAFLKDRIRSPLSMCWQYWALLAGWEEPTYYLAIACNVTADLWLLTDVRFCLHNTLMSQIRTIWPSGNNQWYLCLVTNVYLVTNFERTTKLFLHSVFQFLCIRNKWLFLRNSDLPTHHQLEVSFWRYCSCK